MADHVRDIPERSISLALAVNPVDAVTGRPLRSDATVTVDGVHESPRLNPSGYWLFLDPPVTLPGDTVTITISPSAKYVPRTYEVDVTTLSPRGVRVSVYPSTAYPFGPEATRYEGVVTDGSDPIPGATVRVEHTDLETRSDTDGSFVLPVRGVVSTESADSEDALRVDPNATDPAEILDYAGSGSLSDPTLAAEHSAHGSTTVDQAIDEGDRVELAAPIEL